MRKKTITVYDIAKEAKVSVSTVSRVLTGSAPVREEKRMRVLQIIDRYDFKPNALARSLFKKESMMIGFILPDITNPFFSAVFLETEKWALQLGYTILLCNSMNDSAIESKYLRILSEKQVDGIIFMGGRINESRTNKEFAEEMRAVIERIPVVMINGKMAGVECYNVRTDEREGIFKLVKYLSDLGHKKLGFIGGIVGITSTDIKLKAFKQAVKQYGMEYNEEWVIQGSFSIESGIESMEKLLKKSDLPSAVLAVNDFVAIGAIKAAKRNGLKVPDNMSIAGFDDIYLTEIVSPGITTVAQNYSELGKTAMDMIVKIVNGQKVKKDHVIKTELVVRDSCREIN